MNPGMRSVEAAIAQFQNSDPDAKSFVDFNLLTEEVYAKFWPFAMMGTDQIVGLRLMPPGGRAEPMYGLEGNRLVTLDVIDPGKMLGFIPRNVPHHLPNDYGWWHLNGTEEFYFTIPLNSGSTCLVLLEGNPVDRVDVFAWYCQSCYSPLYARDCNVGRVGLDGYWETEAAAIETFNNEEALRICANCASVHPLAFSVFDAEEAKTW
jgi:hypothetical protein